MLPLNRDLSRLRWMGLFVLSILCSFISPPTLPLCFCLDDHSRSVTSGHHCSHMWIHLGWSLSFLNLQARLIRFVRHSFDGALKKYIFSKQSALNKIKHFSADPVAGTVSCLSRGVWVQFVRSSGWSTHARSPQPLLLVLTVVEGEDRLCRASPFPFSSQVPELWGQIWFDHVRPLDLTTGGKMSWYFCQCNVLLSLF